MTAITFTENTYTKNFFTGGESLVHLEGAPRVFFKDETFNTNGDMIYEAANTYGLLSGTTTYSFSPTSQYTMASGITGSMASNTLGRSLIYVART